MPPAMSCIGGPTDDTNPARNAGGPNLAPQKICNFGTARISILGAAQRRSDSRAQSVVGSAWYIARGDSGGRALLQYSITLRKEDGRRARQHGRHRFLARRPGSSLLSQEWSPFCSAGYLRMERQPGSAGPGWSTSRTPVSMHGGIDEVPTLQPTSLMNVRTHGHIN
ncbi:hypothetical protein OIDMADRAFT_142744 [Oidiodendron maius Zn]|uniref:Uncharacterized protein n=1 Tax=Oidiodendron maius (strain Zn) TaxID=913774 RepID=A0A0C3H9L5_OIDMZ|nr:hypothetical protein OIDMADRAFT_142744 [Oidiodendron maius Zn]